jgi:SpoVK/Ycf46/Vps4 family AAA+-type ATPase
MARADLLLDLVKAAAAGDQPRFRSALEALIVEERAKHHDLLADRLAASLGTFQSPNKTNGPTHGRPLLREDLVYEMVPERSLDDLILLPEVRDACRELVEEQMRRELLNAHNLEPRHRVLLVGPPGNGKTSLAEAIASEMSVPLVAVRYEAVIASFLGETASRLSRLFDEIRPRRCVLFFDEFDVVGKERGDLHETGEIKRVVSSLLLQIDKLPSHVVVVTATNHPELLDRAVWRRFQLRLDLPPPTRMQATEWFERFEERIGLPLGSKPSVVAQRLRGLSFSELEQFGLDVQRRYVLSLPNANISRIIKDRLRQWDARFTLRKASPKAADA